MENDKDTEKKERKKNGNLPLTEQVDKSAKRNIKDLEERFSRRVEIRAAFYGPNSLKRLKQRRKSK
jgi:hypothetical protein